MRRLVVRLAMAGVGLCALSLTACATPHYPVQTASVGGASRHEPPRGELPQTTGRRQVGKPYEIRGKWYTPHEDPDYDETGLASWYGSSENGNKTANGETFDMSLWTAAHKTLPLPSIVEVINLDNGKRMNVRVNDRGPFVDGRIIDLSKAAAEELGVVQSGLAKVRVRYVGPAPLEVAKNDLRPAGRTPLPTRYDPPAPVVAERPPSRPAAVLPPTGGDFRGYEVARVVEPAPLAGRLTLYEVQVGAFSQRVNAERAVDLVAGAGSAEIRPMERDGTTLWRVVVGRIGDASLAAQVREEVAASGFVDARVLGPF